MLVVSNLKVCYGNIQALKGVSFHVDKGEILALIGSNGAGKSTLLNAVMGVKAAAAGDIRYKDKSMMKLAPLDRVKRKIILCPEGRQVFPKFTVRENLEMGAYTVKSAEAMNEGFERAFKLFPVLKEREKQPAGTLSGGEQQMLAIGRAMMSSPELLMMDEPSLGLAPIISEQIFDLIGEIRSQGTTVLLIEQNAMAALEIADRAYVLETGSISLEGTGKELLDNEDVIKSYLGG
ncbi:MAG: ABC transporter ATP-binding protein [Clostridiales bacterium]|nr:ABC transporter ATP-binding protein [Clostridiales bacterium]